MRSLLLFPLFVASVGSLASADTTITGFSLTRTVNPVPSSVSCSLPDGDFVTFDGTFIRRWNADGTLEDQLGFLSNSVFASFVRLTPAGDAVIIGDSGGLTPTPAGDLHHVALDGSGVTFLGSIPYNYDGEFNSSGDLLVSAAPLGSSAGTDIFRVTIAPYSATLIGHVDNASGPVAIARNGDLFYGMQQDFTLANGPQDIVRWSAGLIASGTFLNSSNAVVYATFPEPTSALEFDRERLYASENRYLGNHRIRRVRPNGQVSPVVVTADDWITGMRFASAGSSATFDAYQPGDGVRLIYTTSDFFMLDDQVTVAPVRPTLTVSGLGTTGVGPVQFNLTGGVPNGSALLTYCPQTLLFPVEQSYPLPQFTLLTPFLLQATTRFQFLIPTEAAGAASLTLWTPGGLAGLNGWQFHVGRSNGVQIGSSNAVTF